MNDSHKRNKSVFNSSYLDFVNSVVADCLSKKEIKYDFKLTKNDIDNTRIDILEEISFKYISNNGPRINYRFIFPQYNFEYDLIELPSINNFFNSLDYYYILFHELAHSTSCELRLGRDINENNRDFEEMIAEFSSVYILTNFGFEPYKHSSDFIRSHVDHSEIICSKTLDIKLASNIAALVGSYIIGGGYAKI